MSLRKRKHSLKIQKAEARLMAMAEIDARYGKKVNYGGDYNPLSRIELKKQIEVCTELTDEYNLILMDADKMSIETKTAEESLGNMFTRVLAGSVSIFGVDSNEVHDLGGTRKSDRKRKQIMKNYNINNN